MDPDAALANARLAADKLKAVLDAAVMPGDDVDHDADLEEAASQLVESVDALDRWMRHAGHKPAAWSPSVAEPLKYLVTVSESSVREYEIEVSPLSLDLDTDDEYADRDRMRELFDSLDERPPGRLIRYHEEVDDVRLATPPTMRYLNYAD